MCPRGQLPLPDDPGAAGCGTRYVSDMADEIKPSADGAAVVAKVNANGDLKVTDADPKVNANGDFKVTDADPKVNANGDLKVTDADPKVNANGDLKATEADAKVTEAEAEKEALTTTTAGGDGSDDGAGARSAPDGGWGWVILVATFFNYIVVSAIWYSFSVLYREYAAYFDQSLASIGVMASVEAASLHFTGAFCGGLVERFGSRPVAMVGSAVAAAALFAGAFVNNIKALCAVYGIAGSGIGLSYVSFVVIVQQYFDKRRALASGFSLTGFSLASFSLPPFTRWLIDLYGWRGTLIILSGFYLNGIVLAALLRPLPPRPAPPRARTRHTSISQRLSRQISMERTKSRVTKCASVCRRVFDYTMFKDARFVLYGVGTFFTTLGHIAFFMHLINRALATGIDSHMATFLPSIYGIANGVCRLLFSVVASLPKANRTLQYGAWIVAGGAISCLTPLANSFVGTALICAGFGMSVGSFVCIQYPALVDILGVEKIARATGLLQLFIGAAGLIATPLAGWIFDVTGDFDLPYLVLGSLMTLGGAIILVIPCRDSSRCCRKPAPLGRPIPHVATMLSMDPEKGVLRDSLRGKAAAAKAGADPTRAGAEDFDLDCERQKIRGRLRTWSATSALQA